MAVRPGALEAINVARIQDIKRRNPKACGFQEVAPGVWVRVDCQAYQPATKAVTHLSPAKARVLGKRKVQWQPYRHLAASLKASSAVRVTNNNNKPPTQPTTPEPPPEPVAPPSPPESVDLRASNLVGPLKDQGPVGACTAFSLSSVIDNAAIRAGKLRPNDGARAASANHVWSGYGYPQMGIAADNSLGRPIGTMGTWGQSHAESCKIADPIIGDCGPIVSPPVVAGTWRADRAIVAKHDRASSEGAYKIASFERLGNPVTSLDEVINSLASGNAIWVGMRIDAYTWSNMLMKDGVIPDWSPTSGHAVAMVGYRNTPSGRQFLIQNSWGKSWGNDGYAWVSQRMVQSYMHYAYTLKLSDPVLQDARTDDDCGPNELIDYGTGLCAAICAGDVRPNRGCAKR